MEVELESVEIDWCYFTIHYHKDNMIKMFFTGLEYCEYISRLIDAWHLERTKHKGW